MSRKKHRKKHHEKPRESPREAPAEIPREAPQESHKPGPGKGNEESQARLSILVYTLAAVAMGYASLLASPLAGNMLTILLGLVTAWLVGRLVQLLVGRKDAKWLIGNGLFIYLFVWLVAWIFFFNLLG
jgi:Flp pilus assembly protein TadB